MFPTGAALFNAWMGSLTGLVPAALAAVVAFGGLICLVAVRAKDVQDDERKRGELAAEAAAAAASLARRDARKRLLIVDDSAVARAKLKKLFEHGFEVVLACDGQEALDAIEARMEAGERFSAVLTDLEMPGMDGFGLIAALQGGLATEDLPIVAITGSEDLQARVRSCQGLYGIFQKPWVDRELLKRIEAISSMPERR